MAAVMSADGAPLTHASWHGRRRLILVRHGETTWSRTGRYTGRTDLSLTSQGARQASALRPYLADLAAGSVFSSPLRRARRTADLAGVTAEIEPDLAEWDYGALEGRTEWEISQALGGPWSIWNPPADLAPRESLTQVAIRADRVIGRVEPLLDVGGDVLLFAHAHLLSILAARWLRLPPEAAVGFGLSPASASVLGYWDGDRAMIAWNFTPWRCASSLVSCPS